MSLLVGENLKRSFGERTLFENLNISIAPGQKVALIARNGAGKTSLLRILAGKDSPEGGTVRLLKDMRMGYLPQEPDLDEEKTISENVLSGGNAMVNAVKAYEEALELQAEDQSPEAHEKLEKAINQMEAMKAWDYETKINQILTRLNIHHLNQKVSTLSGGQKKRIALAKVLIDEPDILLMDEPTNHLDLEMTEWLENYLSRGKLALLLITHDRYFLDNVCNEILELDNKQLYKYNGNYSYFLEKKNEREENESKEVDAARNLLRKELEWMRRQPKARTTKSKSRISAFYDTEEKAQGKTKEDGLQINVSMQRLGGKIIECEHVNKRFAEKIILDDFSYIFQKGERLGIVGPNGIGKTTFLDVITGKQQPDSGKLSTGETVVFGYFTQAGIKLPEDKRVIEVITDIAEVIPMGNGEQLTAAGLLLQFGFDGPRQYTFVSNLSGGEKRRLHLLTVLIKNPNFLILDEPTNDLDIITLNTLEEFLFNFKGCLLIVSHDRYFLDKLCQHLFIFEGKGKIRDFNGKYTEYREVLAEEEKAAKNKPLAKPVAAAPAPAAPTPPAATKRKPSFKEQQEFDTIEAEMEKLENKKSELENRLASGNGSGEDFQKWGKELEKVQQDLEAKTNRWLELSELF